MVAAATRLSAFRHIAWTRISQGLSGPIAQIVLGLSGAGAPGLAIGFIVGQSSGTGMILSQVLMAEPRLGPSVSWRGIWGVMLRYAKFPLFASWSRILEMAGSGSVLFLVFSAFYSPEIAGYMFLTERVIARPLLIVSTSLLQVFTGEAGQAVLREPARLRRRFWQVLPRQFVLAAGWIGLANLAAGWSFPSLFGPALGRRNPVSARIECILPRADGAASGLHATADHGAAGHGSDMAGRSADPRDRQRDRRGAARMVGINGFVAQCVGPGGRVHHYAGLDRECRYKGSSNDELCPGGMLQRMTRQTLAYSARPISRLMHLSWLEVAMLLLLVALAMRAPSFGATGSRLGRKSLCGHGPALACRAACPTRRFGISTPSGCQRYWPPQPGSSAMDCWRRASHAYWRLPALPRCFMASLPGVQMRSLPARSPHCSTYFI